MKELLFDYIQIIITIVVLTLYLYTHPSSDCDCDIDGNVVYNFRSYIIFSFCTFWFTSFINIINFYCFKNKIILNAMVLTLAYILIFTISLGGIFILQQMNVKNECEKYLNNHKDYFSIFIVILILCFINIIYKCIECRNKQLKFNYKVDDY